MKRRAPCGYFIEHTADTEQRSNGERPSGKSSTEARTTRAGCGREETQLAGGDEDGLQQADGLMVLAGDAAAWGGEERVGQERRERAEGAEEDRKSTRLNSSHSGESRMPSSA